MPRKYKKIPDSKSKINLRLTILATLLWICLIFFINLFSPLSLPNIVIFFLILFTALFATTFRFQHNLIHSSIIALFICLLLILKLFQLLTIFNSVLLLLFIISLYFFTK